MSSLEHGVYNMGRVQSWMDGTTGLLDDEVRSLILRRCADPSRIFATFFAANAVKYVAYTSLLDNNRVFSCRRFSLSNVCRNTRLPFRYGICLTCKTFEWLLSCKKLTSRAAAVCVCYATGQRIFNRLAKPPPFSY